MKDFFRNIFKDPWNVAITTGAILIIFIVVTLAIIYPPFIKKPVPSANPRVEAPKTPDGGLETNIINEEKFSGPIVRYTNQGFDPAEVQLTKKENDTTSCLIKILNESQKELLVRLGPPAEKDNRGFPYSPIKAGESGIIDPRYSGVFNEEFYDRNIPNNTFKVSVDESCFR